MSGAAQSCYRGSSVCHTPFNPHLLELLLIKTSPGLSQKLLFPSDKKENPFSQLWQSVVVVRIWRESSCCWLILVTAHSVRLRV